MDLIHRNGDRLFVSSLDISNHFERQHKNVLQAIENLDCSDRFRRLNFKPSSYNNSQNKALPCYEITRDGFVFLCMGFTGAQAAIWKERYIEAFNQMETALKQLPAQQAPQQLALAHEIGALRNQLNQQNTMIIGLYNQLAGAQKGHIRAVTQLLSAQKRQAQKDAKARLLQMAADGYSHEAIAQATGKNKNNVRQYIFQARRDGVMPKASGQLSLGFEGGAA